MTNKSIRVIAISLLMGMSKLCLGQELPKRRGNFSFSISHGLNHHLDGTPTFHWDEHSGINRINMSTSYGVGFDINKVSVSLFYESFSNIYKDSLSVYNEEVIWSRSGKHLGLSFSYKIPISPRITVLPYMGIMLRTGNESYGSLESRYDFMSYVELKDIGVSPGLSVQYSLGKGFSVFALTDYTRFIYLKSTESGKKDFYDGPTLNYIRTRLGVEYSLSHILKPKG